MFHTPQGQHLDFLHPSASQGLTGQGTMDWIGFCHQKTYVNNLRCKSAQKRQLEGCHELWQTPVFQTLVPVFHYSPDSHQPHPHPSAPSGVFLPSDQSPLCFPGAVCAPGCSPEAFTPKVLPLEWALRTWLPRTARANSAR